jgi:prepilin-type N-terminal cleavage/methylation domain-containing protein
MGVQRGADDAGFTLVETLVALTLIGMAMAALGPFFAASLIVTGEQSGRQVAVQLASDAMERVRSLKGTGLLEGRSRPAVLRQWAAAPAQVRDAYAGAMLCAWDPKLSGEAPAACGGSAAAGAEPGAQAAVPTEPVEVSVAGVPYLQHWYVGECWQPVADDARCDTTAGVNGAGVADVRQFRVVVAVTWSHHACPQHACVYLTTTLASPADDPSFNTSQA